MNAVEFAEGHAPLFHAHIRPSRSLSQRGQTLIFCAAAVPSLAFAAIFVAQGYWPVAPFLGLDVALLALAFWVIRRRGAAFEEVIVSAEAILIRRADGLSQAEEDHLPTTWTRLERDEDPDFGCQSLRLSHRGRSAAVGGMLSPSERSDFGHALAAALARAQKGGLAARPTSPPFRATNFGSAQ